MNPQLLLVLGLLEACVAMFIANKPGMDVVALVAMILLPLTGIVSLTEALTSAAFMTPVSSPVNTLVLIPGRYRFGDFVRIGVPFTIVVLILSGLLVPWLLPLYP